MKRKRDGTRDNLAQGADEMGEGYEVGLAIVGQGDESDVFHTGLGDTATRHQATGIGGQYDLKQHRGWLGRSPDVMVVEPDIERR